MTMSHDEERSAARWIAMWFAICAALILFGCVNECSAATKYVKQSGSASWSAGTDSSTAISIATFNANATGGDVALMLGNFTTAPIPANSGSHAAGPIVYRSAYNDSNSVTVTGQLTLYSSGAHGDSLISWQALTFSQGVALGYGTGGRPNSRLVMARCKVAGFMRWDGVYDSRLDSCHVGTTSTSESHFNMSMGGYSATNYSRRDTVRDCQFYRTLQSTGSNNFVLEMAGTDHLMQRCRWYVNTTTASVNQIRGVRVLASNRNVMTDCSFYMNNAMSDGGGDEPLAWGFKDGAANCKFYRDTVVISGNSPSGGYGSWINFSQAEDNGAMGGNAIRNCLFKNMTNRSNLPISWYTQGVDGDSVVGNVFLAVGGPTTCNYNRGTAVSSGGTVFDHNLFVTYANTPALTFENKAANQSVSFTNNLFYTPNLTNADTASSRAINYGRASDWGTVAVGPTAADSNIFYAPQVTTKRLVLWSGGTSAPGMAPWLTTRAPLTLDQNSRVAPLAFTDSTSAAFDAHPLVGSAANVGPNNYVGPFPYNTPETDVTRPAGVTNLSHASASDSTTHLLWTSPGDDSTTCTGTQQATAYDLRYSTSRLFQSNFNAAARAVVTWDGRTVYGDASFAFVPSPCGSNEEIIVAGLTPGTKHYFALKTADEAGNWSALSNLDSVTTTGGDTQRPAPTTSLVATATSTTSIRLTWRSVGDDSLSGTPASYTVKRSTSTIAEGNFAAATTVTPPSAVVAGTAVTLDVTSLSAGTTYYFAIKTTDDASNASAISNVASCATMSVASGSSKAAKVTIMALGRR